MKTTPNRFCRYRMVLFAFFTGISLAMLPIDSHSSSCNLKKRISGNIIVYDSTPLFSTSRGWVYGPVVAKLGSGSTIFICSEKTVSFGFEKQVWTQISYYINKKWNYGWVLAKNISAKKDDQQRIALESDQSLIGLFVHTAYAATSDNQTRFQLTENPPTEVFPPSAPDNGQGQAVSLQRHEPDDNGALMRFYLILFVVMILGMAAKGMFDFIQADKNPKINAVLRRMIAPLVISPMVFLTFMQSADFASEGFKEFIILILMSFQNGFFWQTVLVRTGLKEAG